MSPCSEHPEFILPKDRNSKIWRFMDLAKFLYAIQNRCLCFSSAKVVAENFDEYEGKYPKETWEAYMRDHERLKQLLGIKNEDYKIPSKMDMRKALYMMMITTTYLNCWHKNEVDTPFMWSLYTDRKLGIAIQSTVERLCDSFEYTDYEVFIGCMQYGEKIIQTKSIFTPFLYKRIQFKEENEIRAIILRTGYKKQIQGIAVPIDIDVLIENVYLLPKTKIYIAKIIENLLSKYGMDTKVKFSTLDEPTPY